MKLRRLLGLLILMISLALLAWGFWPFGDVIRSIPVNPAHMQLPTPAGLLFLAAA